METAQPQRPAVCKRPGKVTLEMGRDAITAVYSELRGAGWMRSRHCHPDVLDAHCAVVLPTFRLVKASSPQMNIRAVSRINATAQGD